MVRARMRLSGLCTRCAMASVRVKTQPQQCEKSCNSNDKAEFSNNGIEFNFNGYMMVKPESEGGKRVLVVVDSDVESKAALQWALSHTVQSQNTIVLLHITKPKQGVS